MKRGKVRWYAFSPPNKRRPVFILTRDSAIRYLNALTVAPITSTIRNIPSEVSLNRDEGLLSDCVANLDNIQTVSKAKIGSLITTLSPDRMEEVRQAISFALGFDAFLVLNASTKV
jgi:mRNA interferase MazF